MPDNPLLQLSSDPVYTSPKKAGSGMDIFGSATAELPGAARDLALEAWQDPISAIGDSVKTVVVSGVIGGGLGYILPAKGPAALAVAAVFTVPAVWHAGKRLFGAYSDSLEPGADTDAIARNLARDTISGSYHFALSMAGGYKGAQYGAEVATAGGMAGRMAQTSQRAILSAENRGMLALRSMLGKEPVIPPGPAGPKFPGGEIHTDVGGKIANTTLDSRLSGSGQSLSKPDILPEELPFFQRRIAIANRRLDQWNQGKQGSPEEMDIFLGSTHGHSRRSDGIGDPPELYAKSKEAGQDFTAITDHNHATARKGVPKDGPRAEDQAGTPTIAEDPALYALTFAEAEAATVPGQYVGLVGIEIGTIGKVGGHGHKHIDLVGPVDIPLSPKIHGAANYLAALEGKTGRPLRLADIPREQLPALLEQMKIESIAPERLGGVNHINLFEVPTFFESVKPARTGRGLFQRFIGETGEYKITMPEVVKINDGDFKTLAAHLANLKDTTGGRPVVQLNHPRYRADENPNLPRSARGRDFGQKSFRSQREWREQFVDPYVRQIELIKGGALTPEPVEIVPAGHIDPTSFAGYIDKGVHASPTFGRDFHFGDPVGNPGTTGILARYLDKPGLMDALRQRRTFATTNGEKLQGTLWGNEVHPMGSILDQAAAPELSLSVKIRGDVAPDATYKVKILGDRKIGDKKLAEVIDEVNVTGAELLQNNSRVSFDPIDHVLGRKSAYYAEVHRTDPITGHTDKMWTAPIWVEPLTGESHSLMFRSIAGNTGNMYYDSLRHR